MTLRRTKMKSTSEAMEKSVALKRAARMAVRDIIFNKLLPLFDVIINFLL
jgi:hypothetical protein